VVRRGLQFSIQPLRVDRSLFILVQAAENEDRALSLLKHKFETAVPEQASSGTVPQSSNRPCEVTKVITDSETGRAGAKTGLARSRGRF
jgi:hypothetical protein